MLDLAQGCCYRDRDRDLLRLRLLLRPSRSSSLQANGGVCRGHTNKPGQVSGGR